MRYDLLYVIGMRSEFLSLNVADSFLYVVRTFSGLKIKALTFVESAFWRFFLLSDKLAKFGKKMRQILSHLSHNETR